MTVGERIKQLREAIGMSQDELAKRMGYKDRSSISKIEKSSDDNIYLDTVQKAADILNCSPLYLMGWDDKPSLDDSNKGRSERLNKFIDLYSQLNQSNQELVDNMIQALTSNQ